MESPNTDRPSAPARSWAETISLVAYLAVLTALALGTTAAFVTAQTG